jgi:two-component system chemotaxis sensor kinase CheA
VADQYQGQVSLRTEAGKSTALQLSVPISLSALDVLVVEAGTHVAALPLDAVRRTFRVPIEEIAHTANGQTVVVESKVLPFVALSRLLEPSQSDADEQAVWSAVLIESGDSFVTLGVNRLLGTESIVARALPNDIDADDTIAGVSLDVDGNPRLLLDVEGLLAASNRAGAAPRAVDTVRAPVLVIDDSLTTRMLEQSILESAGYEVDTATSGEEGLVKAARRRYALFLVDVEMPGMNGFTFIETTRADPKLRDIPAILVTSLNSAQDIERGRAAGASAHIVKSEFDQTDLLARIRRLIG